MGLPYEIHRCDEAARQDCELRRYPKMTLSGMWELYALETDLEMTHESMKFVCDVKWCPFCGEEMYGLED